MHQPPKPFAQAVANVARALAAQTQRPTIQASRAAQIAQALQKKPGGTR